MHYSAQSIAESAGTVPKGSEDLGDLSSFPTEMNPINRTTAPRGATFGSRTRQAPRQGWKALLWRRTREKKGICPGEPVFSPLTASMAPCILRGAVFAHSIMERQVGVMRCLPLETQSLFSSGWPAFPPLTPPGKRSLGKVSHCHGPLQRR